MQRHIDMLMDPVVVWVMPWWWKLLSFSSMYIFTFIKTHYEYIFPMSNKLNGVYCIYSSCNPGILLFFYTKARIKPFKYVILHCDIIQGCSTIKFYTHMHTTIIIITFLLAINDKICNSFSCLQLCNTWVIHTRLHIRTLDIGRQLELWIEDGDDCDTFAVVVIMTEHIDIVGHALKVITFYHLLLFNLHMRHYLRVHYN